MRGTIIVGGSLAQKPRQGGFAWVFLNYLLGFQRLGWDVLFLDRLEPGMCVDRSGRPCPCERSLNLEWAASLLSRFGLGDSFSVSDASGGSVAGLPRARVLERVRASALLLNVMGFVTDPEVLDLAPRRAFLDIDPGFAQMWQELGLARLLQGHDAYVTVGENVGRPGCTIPTCGLAWITTPQPVVLEHWPAQQGPGDGWFSSVARWRGAYGPVEYGGKTYGLRVHEFRKFARLPRESGRAFRLALDIHPSERADLERLDANGWVRLDPAEVAGDPWSYRSFLQASSAEFLVAKGMYVESGSGWLSERSLCYLASGRPVLAQETGAGRLYPTGRGLLTFSSMEEAIAGVEELGRDYPMHARAARELAGDYFDSDKVLGRLLEELGVT